MPDDLQEFQGDSTGIAPEGEAIPQGGEPKPSGIRDTLPEGDLTKDAVWKKAQSTFQHETTQERNARLALERQVQQLETRLAAYDRVAKTAGPDVAQQFVDAGERAELEQELAEARAYRAQQQNNANWKAIYEQNAQAMGIDPHDPEYQDAISAALTTGDIQAPARKAAEMVKRTAAPQPAPQKREVPESNVAVPPAGGAPAPKSDALARLRQERQAAMNEAKARGTSGRDFPVIRQQFAKKAIDAGFDPRDVEPQD